MPKIQIPSTDASPRFLSIGEHFEDFHRNGKGYKARCPVHGDSNPSLSINEGEGGRIIMHCHVGCRTEDILAEVGLQLSDLMPQAKSAGKPRIVETYDYRNAKGKLLYQVVRYEPKDFRQRKPNGASGWDWSVKGIERVPYRLPELLTSKRSAPVFIVEGEKDADRLASIGLIATTNAGGAGKWSAELSKHLTRRDVVILPDNDEPGRLHAQQVAAALHGVAASVKIVELPNLTDKGDVSDWLDAGGSKARLLTLVRKAPPYAPYESTSPDENSGVRGATMAEAAKLVAGIRYLIRDWIPAGMVTGVVAEPGFGKSAYTLYAIARPIVTGCDWFNGTQGPATPGYVLWCPTENDMAITIQRMRNWSIPMEKFILPFEDDPLASVNLTDAGHLERIESLVNRYSTRLVVVDSLRGGHSDDENNSRVGRVLQSLAGIAERTSASVVVVHHTRKLTFDEEITANSSRGSNAILAMMRSQIGIDRPDPNSKWCRVRVLKENLGIAPQPVGFLVTDKGLKFGDAPAKPRKQTERDRAADWLEANMQPGKWCASGELLEEAEQFGYSANAIQRAREALGIVKPDHVRKTKGGWEWKLPARRQQTTGPAGNS